MKEKIIKQKTTYALHLKYDNVQGELMIKQKVRGMLLKDSILIDKSTIPELIKVLQQIEKEQQ